MTRRDETRRDETEDERREKLTDILHQNRLNIWRRDEIWRIIIYVGKKKKKEKKTPPKKNLVKC